MKWMNIFFSIINPAVCWHPCQITIGSLTVTSRLVQRKPVLCRGGCFPNELISALNLWHVTNCSFCILISVVLNSRCVWLTACRVNRAVKAAVAWSGLDLKYFDIGVTYSLFKSVVLTVSINTVFWTPVCFRNMFYVCHIMNRTYSVANEGGLVHQNTTV
jgi:hypothetical protein